MLSSSFTWSLLLRQGRNSLGLTGHTLIRAASSSASASSSSEGAAPPKDPAVPRKLAFPLRFAYPEFLPDPERRSPTVERLQRKDLLRRRQQVDLPEFYVGSIVAVTTSEPLSPAKSARFVGRVIQRGGTGTKAWFTVRNVVDGQGIEFTYEMYSPTVQKVETLKLERRLDNELHYLRDCPPEYSVVPLDHEIELLPEGEPVPLNEAVVPLRARPWSRRWEKLDDRLLGYSYSESQLSEKAIDKKERGEMYLHDGWQRGLIKYDLMLHYRETISIEEQHAIWRECGPELEERDRAIRRTAAKRAFAQQALKDEEKRKAS